MQVSKKQAVLNWSGGKDSAMALWRMRSNVDLEIGLLLTSVNSQVDRVSIHGVRRSLMLQQAGKIGLPLEVLAVPGNLTMEDYDRLMSWKMNDLKERGITHSVFGDIFLEDLRAYRESRLKEVGMEAVFPLWKNDTLQLVHEFIDTGFKAIIVSVDASKLDESFCGRILDPSFVKDLPSGVDPCGENGEFHTFVFDGPIFNSPVKFEVGEIVQRTYSDDRERSWSNSFWFCDLEEIQD